MICPQCDKKFEEKDAPDITCMYQGVLYCSIQCRRAVQNKTSIEVRLSKVEDDIINMKKVSP